MAKMGRPKSDDPKANKLTVRFTDEEYEKLKEYAAENNLTITLAIRKAVLEMLYVDCEK